MRNRCLVVLTLAASCAGPTTARERLASALSDRLGELADPQVGFQKDSTHLRVALATVAFPTVSESVLTDRAKNCWSRFWIYRFQVLRVVFSVLRNTPQTDLDKHEICLKTLA